MRVPFPRSAWRGSVAGLLLALGPAACGAPGSDLLGRRPTSPFSLYGRNDMRAGLPYDVMVESAKKESSQALSCLPLWARARRCAVRIEHGILAAVVDSTDRIIRLVVTLDETVRGGKNVHGQLIMRDVLRETQTAWSAIAPATREGSDESPPQRRFVDRTRRWGATLWYPPPRGMSGAVQQARSEVDMAIALPDSFGITDLPAYSLLVQLRPPEATPRPRPTLQPLPPPAPPTGEQLMAMMRSDLRELTIKQEGAIHAAGRYETSLEHLRVVSTVGVRFALVNPTSEGWSAVATHPSLPGLSCVVFAGIVVERPRTKKSGLTGAPGEVVCDEVVAQ